MAKKEFTPYKPSNLRTPGKRIRRSGVYGEPIEKLYYEDKKTGCWLWCGTFNGLGHPIYKGWQYARGLVYDKHHGPLLPDQYFRGQYCGNRSCVRPLHQIVLSKREVSMVELDISVMATMLRLCERGKMLFPEGGRFTEMAALLKAGLAKSVGVDAHGMLVEPTERAMEIWAWHKKLAEAREKNNADSKREAPKPEAGSSD